MVSSFYSVGSSSGASAQSTQLKKNQDVNNNVQTTEASKPSFDKAASNLDGINEKQVQAYLDNTGSDGKVKFEQFMKDGGFNNVEDANAAFAAIYAAEMENGGQRGSVSAGELVNSAHDLADGLRAGDESAQLKAAYAQINANTGAKGYNKPEIDRILTANGMSPATTDIERAHNLGILLDRGSINMNQIANTLTTQGQAVAGDAIASLSSKGFGSLDGSALRAGGGGGGSHGGGGGGQTIPPPGPGGVTPGLPGLPITPGLPGQPGAGLGGLLPGLPSAPTLDGQSVREQSLLQQIIAQALAGSGETDNSQSKKASVQAQEADAEELAAQIQQAAAQQGIQIDAQQARALASIAQAQQPAGAASRSAVQTAEAGSNTASANLANGNLFGNTLTPQIIAGQVLMMPNFKNIFSTGSLNISG